MSEQPTHELVRWSFNEQGTLGDIELPQHEVLGQGSQAFVLYGRDPGGNEYAVKIHQSAAADAKPEQHKASEAFRREAKILEELKHPHIIGMYGSGVHYHKIPVTGPQGEQVDYTVAYDYIITEFAEHGSVADRIRRLGPERILPPTESALVLLHASEGLINAHANGVVHGDMKPSNIMLLPGKDGLVGKVADFGIARGGGESVETELGTALRAFSAPYASAHQLEGGLARERDDIYALGITGYYLFTGGHPIRPRHSYDAEAHRSTIVRPMQPQLPEGREIVEELEPVIMPIFQQGERDFAFPYSSMAAFQDKIKEGLGRAEARAARATTFILLNGTETTWPVKSDDLARAELPVERQEAKAQDPIASPPSQAEPAPNGPAAGTPEMRIDEFTPITPPGVRKDLFDVTTAIVNTPSDTERLVAPSRRRFLKFGAGIGALAAGTVVTGVWMDWFGGESANNQAEQKKLNQERKAVADFSYTILDLMDKQNRYGEVPDLLRELIPYDPQGVPSHFEKVGVDLNSTEEAKLAAHLVPYNPDSAQQFMQGFLGSESYDEALLIAIRLASYAQTPVGKNGNWEDEVRKVRTAFVNSSRSVEARQNAEKLLNAAQNPREPIAAVALQEASDHNEQAIIEVLGAALAPHNPAAVADMLKQRIDIANGSVGKNLDDNTRTMNYEVIEALARSLAPYAPDAVAAAIGQINVSGQYNDRASDAQMRVATSLVPYKPEATVAHFKGGSENPNEWHTDRWNMAVAIALTKTNPDTVRAAQPHMNHQPYQDWIALGLQPEDAVAQSDARDILPTINGLYLSDIPYVLDALLMSRQPKL